MRRISRIDEIMNSRAHLISLIEAYSEAKGLSPSRVTTLVMNSGAVFGHLVQGGDITVGRYERAVLWFSTNWPADVAWPEGVSRPQPKAVDQDFSVSSPEEVA